VTAVENGLRPAIDPATEVDQQETFGFGEGADLRGHSGHECLVPLLLIAEGRGEIGSDLSEPVSLAIGTGAQQERVALKGLRGETLELLVDRAQEHGFPELLAPRRVEVLGFSERPKYHQFLRLRRRGHDYDVVSRQRHR
jgi:hypothetical protein